MNYNAIHDSIIARSRNRQLQGYFERHHVIPRCMGGTDEKQNIVCLTAKEHYLVHILLAKMYGGALWKAARMMGYGKRNSAGKKITGSMFSIAKKRWSENIHGKGNPAYKRIRSAHERKKISETIKGKPKSAQHVINARKNRIYNPLSADAKIKASKSNAIRRYKTPAGIFHSTPLAAKANNVSIPTIRNRCKSNNFPGYKYLPL